jgi:hypothetical protein
MLIISIDKKKALTLYQSWWRHPEIMGISKGSAEYRKLQKMWRLPLRQRPSDREKKVRICSQPDPGVWNQTPVASYNLWSDWTAGIW